MPFLETLSAVGSILGGLGGIFGKKPTPRSNVVSQAAGAREAAEKYGFNPLTMLQYGQPGGVAGGGAPPLASVEFLTNGLNELSAELNGDNERQRQADQLNLDLAKLKLEQARAGVAIVPPAAVNSVGGGRSPLGRQDTALDVPGASTVAPPGFRLTTGNIKAPDPMIDRGPGVFMFNRYWEDPPDWTPPAVVEEQQGELAGWLYTVPYAGAWVGHQIGKPIGNWLGERWLRKREIERELDPNAPVAPRAGDFPPHTGAFPPPWFN